MDIDIDGLHKRFDATAALDGVDLRIASGELLAVLGPSGAGKTTLLRVLAGLETPDAGRIRFGARDAAAMSLRERRVGLVFQHYALFPHLSVFENVAFGLRARPRRERPDANTRARRVTGLLQRMQIDNLAMRRPDELSGGQKQRVALARAMAIEPSVLLLDEPFGALDAKVRIELRRWLRRIHDDTGYTTVLVTHDQDEALELADRVVVMHAGRIVQVGQPEQVYREPASAFVYGFIGRSNRLDGTVRDGIFRAEGSDAAFTCANVADGPAQLFSRPHGIARATAGEGLTARVLQVRALAGRRVVTLRLPEQPRTLEMDVGDDSAQAVPAPGESVAVRPSTYRVFAIP